jgi:hypothetical protein
MKRTPTNVFVFAPISPDWGALASRVLVAASRRNRLSLCFPRVGDFALSEKFAMARTPSPARETQALPDHLFWTWFIDNPRPQSSK